MMVCRRSYFLEEAGGCTGHFLLFYYSNNSNPNGCIYIHSILGLGFVYINCINNLVSVLAVIYVVNKQVSETD
jgi:hypothetical protein